MLSSSAFSLDAPGAFGALYGPADDAMRDAAVSAMAEQIGTVYARLGLPAPRVRYPAQGHAIGRTVAERLDGLLKQRPVTILCTLYRCYGFLRYQDLWSWQR